MVSQNNAGLIDVQFYCLLPAGFDSTLHFRGGVLWLSLPIRSVHCRVVIRLAPFSPRIVGGDVHLISIQCDSIIFCRVEYAAALGWRCLYTLVQVCSE